MFGGRMAKTNLEIECPRCGGKITAPYRLESSPVRSTDGPVRMNLTIMTPDHTCSPRTPDGSGLPISA